MRIAVAVNEQVLERIGAHQHTRGDGARSGRGLEPDLVLRKRLLQRRKARRNTGRSARVAASFMTWA